MRKQKLLFFILDHCKINTVNMADDPRPNALKRKSHDPDCSVEICVSIKEYQMFCTCQHLNGAGAGSSVLHQFMTMITSTHPLLRLARLTWMPPHSTANYFLFQAGCCTESHTDTFGNSVWRIFSVDTHKNGFRIAGLQSHVHFVFLNYYLSRLHGCF